MLRRAGVVGIQVLLLLLAVEGVSRCALGRPPARLPLAERRHTEYDPELGWVSRRSVRIDDLYGPGKFLRTNARGYRGALETASTVPAGKRRVVCSGDSFTLGYGVDDDHTWCARLAVLRPGLETVNLGQGGYGIDQAYLWYRREAPALDHQLHLFAFISEDFLRMESDTFLGYGKPVLALGPGGELETRNVPVPRDELRAQWLVDEFPGLAQLATFTLLTRLARQLAPARPPPRSDTLALALRVFEELRALAVAHGSALVLVQLPQPEDLRPGASDAARGILAVELAKRGIAYVDLVPAFRALSPADRAALFIAAGALPFDRAEGHYTEAGNERVARLLLAALERDPAARAALGRPAE